MNWWTSRPPMRGVNLGGWLLLERWMQRSLFAGLATEPEDEYALCLAWGDEAEYRIRRHRQSYITREDFAWIAGHGLNAVRIPFGYWLLEGDPPFIAGADLLDQALRWCDEFGLMAVLDLHGLVGGQSNEHHTGRRNDFRWPDDAACRQRTLQIVEALAQRYAGFACVRGFSIVNEPDPGIPAVALHAFYREAYQRIRRFMSHEQVAVIVPAFPEHRLPEMHGIYQPPEYENVITDLHYYQCFGEWYARLGLSEHLNFPRTHRLPELQAAMQQGWIMVGEWSLRLPWGPPDIARDLPPSERDRVLRQFGNEQLRAYGQTQGWFFWSYKAEHEPEWSFRGCVDRGWLPSWYG